MLVQAGYDKDAPITPSMGKIYKECQRLIDKCRRSYDVNQAEIGRASCRERV